MVVGQNEYKVWGIICLVLIGTELNFFMIFHIAVHKFFVSTHKKYTNIKPLSKYAVLILWTRLIANPISDCLQSPQNQQFMVHQITTSYLVQQG